MVSGCKDVLFAVMVVVCVRLVSGMDTSPIVVVMSGSMEPQFYRGDILLLSKVVDPLRIGDAVVFDLPNRTVPIVHRIISIDPNTHNMMTKGDNNPVNDLGLYRSADPKKLWLQPKDIRGRVRGQIPNIGYPSLWLTEWPTLKFLLLTSTALYYIHNIATTL
jgi:signal peptidase